MRKDDLKERIENYGQKNLLLEAFVLQSAYIESLIKLFVETKLSLSIRDADPAILAALRKRIVQYNLSELIKLLFDSEWLPKEKRGLFDRYRNKRNEVLHDLLKQISSNDFDNEMKIVYDDGQKITAFTEFSIIDDFFGVLEKGNPAFIYNSAPARATGNIRMNERENEIMRLRLEGKTYEVIAGKFGITRERIRQILNTTILKLNGAVPAPPKKPIPIDPSELVEVKDIIASISKAYAIPIDDLLGSRRMANLVFPRHLAIYFLRRNAKLSFPQIAKVMKKKDHTTAIHAYQKMDHLIRSEKIMI